MTSGVGTPLHTAAEMYNTADYTAAVDVHSFALIAYKVFVGKPMFPAATTLPVLLKKVILGHLPRLSTWMDPTVRNIIERGWSMDPDARRSFTDIFDALQCSAFKMMPVVDVDRVTKFVAIADKQFALPTKPFHSMND
jgi:hypothetical protein